MATTVTASSPMVGTVAGSGAVNSTRSAYVNREGRSIAVRSRSGRPLAAVRTVLPTLADVVALAEQDRIGVAKVAGRRVRAGSAAECWTAAVLPFVGGQAGAVGEADQMLGGLVAEVRRWRHR